MTTKRIYQVTVSVNCKPIFGWIYTYFDKFLPSNYKIGIIHMLLFGYYQIFLDWTKFH